MGQGYFSRAWRALLATKNWFGKICLLALVSLVPIFGTIVVFGYLYGWARDAAWGMDNPLPDRIFGNEDGRLYRRGFFALVISFVVGLGAAAFFFIGAALIDVVASFAMMLFDGPVFAGHGDSSLMMFSAFSLMWLLGVMFVSLALSLAVQFFVWAGTMRMSVYDTLGSGFQLSRIGAMLRKDPLGMLKIFLMQLLVSFALGIFVVLVWCMVVFVGLLIGMSVMGAGGAAGMSSYGFDVLAVVGTLAVALFAIGLVYLTCVGSIIIQALVCRSLGYWTAQFDVPHWGAQDQPLPFERASGDSFDASGVA